MFKKRLKALKIPSDIGRLPTTCDKTTFGGFTAEQFKNFIIIYARPCFHGLIPNQYYKNIVLLSESMELACQHSISEDEIHFLTVTITAHHKGFAKLFGKWEVSVNFHMAMHIPVNIRDLEPCPGFWCFAFERLNGELMGYPSSGRR